MAREWSDQEYLRCDQYADSSNLGNRSNLHDRYGTSSMPFREWEAALVEWEPDACVLELGCGPGRFWASGRLPRSLRLALTDLSCGMVDEAKAAALRVGYGDVDGTACDAAALPFADDSFDVVVANHMMYHVPQPHQAVAEIRRVLRPEGVALIATNSPGHMRQLNEIVEAVFGSQSMELNLRFGIDPAELMLRDQFTSITWHSFVNPLQVTSVEHLLGYATSFPPGVDADPSQLAGLQGAFEREVAAGAGVMRIDTRTGAFVYR